MNTLPKNPGQALSMLLQDGSPVAPDMLTAADWSHEDAAARTKSACFHGENVPLLVLHRWLLTAAAACRQIDDAKRAIFYNDKDAAKRCREALPLPEKYNHDNAFCAQDALLGADMQREDAADVIHCIIGKLTEAGELAELLLAAMNGEKFDTLGFIEEVGDSRWYDAIGVPAVGLTLHQADKANERKLTDKREGRYKTGGFAASLALVRDTEAERNAMQQSLL